MGQQTTIPKRVLAPVLFALAINPIAWAAQPVSMPASGPGGESVSRPVEDAEEARLKERVGARWRAVIEGDFDAAYQFETPAYRAVYTPWQFRVQFGRQTAWRMANVLNIHYDNPDVARVQVEVAYRYVEPERESSPALDMTGMSNEIWLRKEGQWWHQEG